MDGKEPGSRRRVGSVKAAINFYDDRRISDTEDSPSLKKTQMDSSVKPSSRTRDLHIARRDIGRFRESRGTAESTKAEAESELSNAKKTVIQLSSLIDESSFKKKAQMKDIEKLEEWKQDEKTVVSRNESYEYARVMRELEYLKMELFKLKLDVASVLEERSKAEKAIEESSSKMITFSKTAEALTKEIEEANEEQVLAELARIEALKELEDIKSQREKEANEFSSKLEITRKKLNEAMEEVKESNELQMKLEETMSDVNLLQNELNSVKEIEKRVQGDDSMKQLVISFKKEDESEDSTLLLEQLEAAKKELALIREEGFQFMASMDVIRNELNHVTSQTTSLKKKEHKAESTLQNLNSKLLRAKSKLESVSSADENSRNIVITLSHALENLKTEIGEAKKEKELISQEITTTEEEIQRTEFEIDMNEERLQGAMQELEAAKTSEALALEKLKTLAEATKRERDLSAKHSSLITISKFEYEYLTNHAAAAEEIADKKVAASQAWIEALKASEKEIVMETKMAQRELKETMLEEEKREAYTKQKMVVSRRVSSNEDLCNWPKKREKSSSSKNFQIASSRKSFKSSGSLTPAKRAKLHASPARHVSPFTLKKRKKVMPNLAKLFRAKNNTRTT